jgi:hypothetical protein
LVGKLLNGMPGGKQEAILMMVKGQRRNKA